MADQPVKNMEGVPCSEAEAAFRGLRIYSEIGDNAFAPTGEQYITFCSGGIKEEGKPVPVTGTRDLVIELFKKMAKDYIASKPAGSWLYWRAKPELRGTEDKYYVRARLLISDLPVIRYANERQKQIAEEELTLGLMNACLGGA